MVVTNGMKRRRVIAAVLLVSVVLIGYFIIRLALFVTGKPTISVNYAAEYNERLRPTGLDPNDNAAPCYKDAFALLPAMPDDVQRIGSRLQEYKPNSIEWKIVESWLTASDEALQIVRQAARKPGFWVELSTINFNDPNFPAEMDFAKFRRALWGLHYKARFLAAKGDVSRACDCIITMCRMARHMGGSGRMQINLGQAMEAVAYMTAFDLLSQADVDSGRLRELQRHFDEMLSHRTPPSFCGDEILLRDAIQRYFTDNGEADGRLIPGVMYDQYRRRNTPRNELAANAAYLGFLYTAWLHPSRQRTAHTLAYLIESANQLIEQTPWELHVKGVNHTDYFSGIIKGNRFLQSVLADRTLVWTIESFYRARITAEALITTMGILRFQKDKGTWPASIEKLAANGYLRQVPIDPYSGKPLVYKKAGDSFILYGYGQDFDDDGGARNTLGRPSQNGDQVFWPVTEHGN